ncbi:MAG: hypothetical protein WCL44_14920 [bacterium]
MTLISTSLARLGSRYSIILDPSRREIHYGALGLMCQRKAGLLIAVEQDGRVESLPLAAEGEDFFCIDQQLTMTSVRFEAQSLALGVSLSVKITAPFWPQDEKTSLVPAYIFDFTVRHLDSVRWNRPPNGVSRKGRLRFALRLKDIVPASRDGGLVFRYPVAACDVFRTGEGGEDREYRDDRRRTPLRGEACDRMIPLAGAWRPGGGELSVAYDISTPAYS